MYTQRNVIVEYVLALILNNVREKVPKYIYIFILSPACIHSTHIYSTMCIFGDSTGCVMKSLWISHNKFNLFSVFFPFFNFDGNRVNRIWWIEHGIKYAWVEIWREQTKSIIVYIFIYLFWKIGIPFYGHCDLRQRLEAKKVFRFLFLQKKSTRTESWLLLLIKWFFFFFHLLCFITLAIKSWTKACVWNERLRCNSSGWNPIQQKVLPILLTQRY